MKKKGETVKILGILLISLFLITTLMTLVSSEGGFFKSLRSWLTGRSTTATFNINISVGNNPPNITALYIASSSSPYEGSTRNITFYFTANDSDGYQNINPNSGVANFTFYNSSTTIVRTNSSCLSLGQIGSDPKTMNFSCTIGIWYFDPTSTIWGVTAYVADSSGATGQNTTVNFTYQSLPAFTMGPGALTFSSLSPNSRNQTSSNDPLILNNTGNFHFDLTTGNISINATNLAGETTGSYKLYAQNFTVGNTTGSNIECGTPANSFFMNNSMYRNITSAVLPYGNLSAGGGAGQSNLYVCLTFAGPELISQAYSTGGPNSDGAWTVKVG